MQREFSFLVQLRVRFEEGEKGGSGVLGENLFRPKLLHNES